MTKKIILILAIIAPFIGYYLMVYLLKLENKKIPIVKLALISLVLIVISLGYFRYSSHFSPDTEYSHPKIENGELVPAENK